MTKKAANNLLNKLEEEGEKRGLTPRFLEFYQRLLRIQSRAEEGTGISKPRLGKKSIDSRIERGLPILTYNKLALDWLLLQDIFAEITVVFADYPELFGDIPKSLKEAMPRPTLSKETARAWFSGTDLSSTIASDDTNENIIEAIIQATFQPFLRSHAKALTGSVLQAHWRHNYCPICGGNPDFAFLDKERGSRWLLCSRCDTEWLFQRLQCPCCGTQDQDALAYHTDDEGIYRLYT